MRLVQYRFLYPDEVKAVTRDCLHPSRVIIREDEVIIESCTQCGDPQYRTARLGWVSPPPKHRLTDFGEV